VPAVEGDELDVTLQKQQQQPKISRPESDSHAKGEGKLEETMSEGLGTAQKLFFIGLIVAVCFAFVKTRKDQRGPAQRGSKSMA